MGVLGNLFKGITGSASYTPKYRIATRHVMGTIQKQTRKMLRSGFGYDNWILIDDTSRVVAIRDIGLYNGLSKGDRVNLIETTKIRNITGEVVDIEYELAD